MLLALRRRSLSRIWVPRTVFHCLNFWDSPNLEDQVPVFLPPRNKIETASVVYWPEVLVRFPALHIFWVVGLERGSVNNPALQNREYGRRDPSCWQRGTLYSQKLAPTSSTSDGRLVGIIRSRTQATELEQSNPVIPPGIGSVRLTLFVVIFVGKITSPYGRRRCTLWAECRVWEYWSTWCI
jgi:hypothetical protein